MLAEIQKCNYNYGVDAIRFEWDERKNRANLRKHGVSFELARRVFLDPMRFSFLERVVDGEERWQTFGVVNGVLLLMVAYLWWDEAEGTDSIEVVRIISARKVTAMERRDYEEGS